MATLGEAFEQIRGNPTLAKEFTQSPQQVLQRLGVNTTGLKVSHAQPPVATAANDSGAFCVSVGCIACVSIG